MSWVLFLSFFSSFFGEKNRFTNDMKNGGLVSETRRSELCATNRQEMLRGKKALILRNILEGNSCASQEAKEKEKNT